MMKVDQVDPVARRRRRVRARSPERFELRSPLTLARAKAGLSRRQLSELTGLSKTYLNDLETRESNPSLATLNTIAVACRVQVADLLPSTAKGRR